MSYNVFVYNDTKPTQVPKVFSEVDSVIGLLCSVIQSNFNIFETCQKFEIAFLRWSCELSNIERNPMIRKHKSASEIASTGKRREKYSSVGTKEKQLLLYNAENCRSMDPYDKEQIHSKHQQKYKSIDPAQKRKPLYERKQKYNDM